jgi:CheY-specific phosphatase CheX
MLKGGNIMYDLRKNIEKSARKICRLLLGSRLYLRKNNMSENDDIYAVNLMMDLNGRKSISLFMERKTVKSVMEKCTGKLDGFRDEVAYDILSEMANMIAGNALSRSKQDFKLSAPTKTSVRLNQKNAMNFSSDLGRLSILIEDMQ